MNWWWLLDGCADHACVDAEVRDDGVLVTSTIDGNNGKVTFTQREWDAFLLAAATSDRWDHTLSAEARAELIAARADLHERGLSHAVVAGA